MPTYVTALLGAFLTAVVATPVARKVAIHFGIVDKPDPRRKLHGRVIARAGGVAVLISSLVGCAIAWFQTGQQFSLEKSTPFLGILAVMVGICLLGLADDIWTLRGRQKLMGQVVLALMLTFAGFQFQSVHLMGIDVPLGLLAMPVTVIWLLGTTNALNLIDGSDGLCSTVGAVITGSLGLMAALGGHHAEAAVGFAMCGALVGFLVFNFPPASIFLGDSGSLLVGLISGALAIRCSLKGPATVAFIAPLAILVIPLFDSTMAIVRRKLTGRSIYTTDRAHLHHNLKERGLSDVGLLVVTGGMCLFASIGAIGGTVLGHDWIGAVSAGCVLLLLIGTKAFGFAEMMLVARRIKHFTYSMLEPAAKTDQIVRQEAVRLQGSRSWEIVWATLTEFAEKQGLSRVHLDLNVPWLHEGFHATWQRSRTPDKLERWSTSLPIHTGGRVLGRLDIMGPVPTGPVFEAMSQLADILQDLEPQIEQLLAAPEESLPMSGSVTEIAHSSDSDSARLETLSIPSRAS
ncbi:MAG: MraY family glycosyltransferase [Pirellulales bacterium]